MAEQRVDTITDETGSAALMSTSKPQTVRLIHLSDPHLPTPGPVPVSALLNKRIFGYLNWHRRRRLVHRPAILDCLTADIQARGFDQLMIGGDLINIALPEEFRRARHWLMEMGPADKIMVVPGNHDTYVPIDWSIGLGQWADYMAGIRFAKTQAGAQTLTHRMPTDKTDFPFVRRIGPVSVIGLNTSPSTAPGLATGHVGPVQQARLRALLSKDGSVQGEPAPILTVILGHHPWNDLDLARHKRLTDGAALITLLDDARQTQIQAKTQTQTQTLIQAPAPGPAMILHGHAHVPMSQRVGAHQTLHLGVASASYAGSQSDDQPTTGNAPPAAGQYHCFDIAPSEAGAQITLTVRAVDPRDMTVYTAYSGAPEDWQP
ncbi:MAG: metallophosphoesterase [Pseudomonadota bacterium]